MADVVVLGISRIVGFDLGFDVIISNAICKFFDFFFFLYFIRATVA